MNMAAVFKKIRELPGVFAGFLVSVKEVFSLLAAKIISLFSNFKKDKNTASARSISKAANGRPLGGVAGSRPLSGAGKKLPGESAYVEGASFFVKLRRSLRSRLESLIRGISRLLNLDRLPPEKRRTLLFAFGGLCALFIFLIILTLAFSSGKTKNGASPAKLAGIPREELFYPEEPDFLPAFLLKRPPKHFWTAEDARPWWKIPGNPEFWQNEIKTAVDKLMEGVP